MAGFARRKYFKLAKGFYGRNKNCASTMIPRVHKSLQKAYIGRKQRPRTMRREWIGSINSAVRSLSINYSRFIFGLNNSNMNIDRKILSDLAANQPYSFKAIVDEIKVQNGILEDKRKYTIEEMIKRNLVTSAKLPPQDYITNHNKGVQIRYVD